MKKFLALVMAMLMLAMSIPAMAEPVVLQDGIAPEVVAPAEGVVLKDVAEREEGSVLAAAFAAQQNHADVIVDLFLVELADNKPTAVTVKAVANNAIFSADGIAWEALAVTAAEDTVSFEVPGTGVVALLVSFVEGMFTDISVTEEAIPVTTEEVAGFNPSVKGKAAPALKETVNLVKAEEKTPVVPTYLVITPLALSAYSSDVVTHEALQWAFNNIVENGPKEIEEEINAALPEGLTYDQMIVHDLFEVSLYGEDGVKLAAEDVHVEFELAAGFEDGETVVVLYSTNAFDWTVLSSDNYELLAGGDIALKMDTLGAVAFLVEMAVEEPAVTSPAN